MAKEQRKSKLTPRHVEILVIVFGSIGSFLALICAMLSLNNVTANAEITTYFKNYAFLTFICLALVRLPIIYHDRTRISVIKNIIFMAVYIAIAVILLFLNFGTIEYVIVSIAYLLTLLANLILRIIEAKLVRTRVVNGILAGLITILALIILAMLDQDNVQVIMQLLLVLIIAICVTDVLFFAFSKIRLGAMIKIIRRTYAFEILYGLFVLILSVSFVFYSVEPKIETFSDGLWYSFAIVTTIGFGDMSAETPIGRILSVLLGIYGLVVVAVLTSIIINFYNETIKDHDDKEIKKIAQEEEQIREDMEKKKKKK